VEQLDILTPAGQPTGQVKAKDAVHRDGDWHLAVHVWVQRPDGALLMQFRASQKENDPNLWDVSVAGHVAAGESAKVAAQREAAEEIGLPIEVDDLEPLFRVAAPRVLNQGQYLDNEWHQVYRVRRSPTLEALTPQPNEVADLRWVSWPEFMRAVAKRRTDWVPHWSEYERLIQKLG
jgi:isopentenyldiphosphate isomerase